MIYDFNWKISRKDFKILIIRQYIIKSRPSVHLVGKRIRKGWRNRLGEQKRKFQNLN